MNRSILIGGRLLLCNTEKSNSILESWKLLSMLARVFWQNITRTPKRIFLHDLNQIPRLTFSLLEAVLHLNKLFTKSSLHYFFLMLSKISLTNTHQVSLERSVVLTLKTFQIYIRLHDISFMGKELPQARSPWKARRHCTSNSCWVAK